MIPDAEVAHAHAQMVLIDNRLRIVLKVPGAQRSNPSKPDIQNT